VLLVSAGDGYESCNERCLEVGLGEAKFAESVEIYWPSGLFSRFDNIAANQSLHVVERQAEFVDVPR
jgi:hypothetical protein